MQLQLYCTAYESSAGAIEQSGDGIASVAATGAMPRLQCSLEEVQWTSHHAQGTKHARQSS